MPSRIIGNLRGSRRFFFSRGLGQCGRGPFRRLTGGRALAPYKRYRCQKHLSVLARNVRFLQPLQRRIVYQFYKQIGQ